jgi:hypothetical protein
MIFLINFLYALNKYICQKLLTNFVNSVYYEHLEI